MPRRKTTRAQDRATRIQRERELNLRDATLAAVAEDGLPEPDPPF